MTTEHVVNIVENVALSYAGSTQTLPATNAVTANLGALSLNIETRYRNTIESIEISDTYERLCDGESPDLFNLFNQAISILSKRIKENRCEEEFTPHEEDVLAIVLGIIDEEG